MDKIARKKSLLKALNKTKSPVPTEDKPVVEEKKSQNEIKKKLTQLRETSAKLKENLQIKDSDFDDEEELNIADAEPKRTFSLYSKTPEQDSEADEMLSKLEGDDDQEEVPAGNRVITITRLPHGFYEKELQQFFGQIAPITAVRVLRNKKTGKSRGAAFVQFTNAEIAQMVVEEMDYYYLMDKVVRVRMCTVPLKHHARIFQDRFDDLHLLERTNHRAKSQYHLIADYLKRKHEPKRAEHIDRIMKGKKKRLENRKNKWASKGIEYVFNVAK
jgi:nucleolar protein 15